MALGARPDLSRTAPSTPLDDLPCRRGHAPGAGAAGGLVLGVVLLVLFVVAAVTMRQGRPWARLTLAILGGSSVVFTVLGLLLSAGLGVRCALAGRPRRPRTSAGTHE